MILNCIVCDAFKKNLKDLFCSYCYTKSVLSKRPYFYFREQDQVSHFYLYKWDEETEGFCRPVVYFLKKQKPEYFKLFVKQFERVGMDFMSNHMYLCPGKSGKQTGHNHAKSLSESFLQQYGGKGVYDVMGSDDTVQKTKNRQERYSFNVGWAPKFTKWVFVDDILVSGGTFNRISKSVGTRATCIFTLFYRPIDIEKKH